ncbi:alpha/beta hydrolase [Thermaerobacillus caldiproteolyticus]|uniref:Esterase/lipase n=1 Tax=Thermaerobacillus caldiproteolyticus TaxID=247480 RepID=A0A7V9Z984_9BACL|nr:alpha/beta fold hydrolase [Anoxybacillus caldiproteolyticus]MBA2876352.1 esterase/lipase [Anoxybacillus caldiproteolyticus]
MIGCLCIHGFTGGPYEVEPLANYLREKTDWLIETPTLPGHGETLQLKGITYDRWFRAAEEELQKLMEECETVYVIGFSMGGVIAAYLATKYRIDKLVLLSAAFYYVNPRQLLKDMRNMIRDGLRRKLKENPLFVRYKHKILFTPITAVLEFRKLVSQVRPRLPDVHIPVLIVHGKEDGIVPIKSAHYLYENVGSPLKKLCFLPSSHHHVCHGPDREQLFKEVEAFLKGNI